MEIMKEAITQDPTIVIITYLGLIVEVFHGANKVPIGVDLIENKEKILSMKKYLCLRTTSRKRVNKLSRTDI